MHTGSCVDRRAPCDAAAMRQVREGLLPVLDALGDDARPWLLLEPTAGQGRSLCAGVEDLEPYLAALDHHPAAGICLDTCHVFAAGAPLDEPGGTTATVDRIVEIGGPGRLRLVHANDSMDVRGAFKDRHQSIGDGHIGVGAFGELFAHPATAGVPFVLETPGSRDAGRRRHPAAQAAAGGSASGDRDGVRPCSPPSALLAMTACWGSTFFLIKDLLDRMPGRWTSWPCGSRSPASRCCCSSPRALAPAVAARRCGTRGARAAVRRRPDPADRRPGPHPGERVRLHHRHVRRLHAAVRRGAAAHPDRGRHLGAPWRWRSPGSRCSRLNGLSVGYGEALTLVSAVIYALHIVGLGAWSTPEEAMGMSIVQLLVITAVCLVATAPDGIVLPRPPADWLSVVYMAVFAGRPRAGRPDLGAGAPAADPHARSS